MGLRYEMDSRKATNGPMIFFSILRDETFEEELRNAFISGLSFYAYRHGKDNMLCFGSSETFIEGIGDPGFVIGMFDPDSPIITIPYKPSQRSGGNYKKSYCMPENSTLKAQYLEGVEKVITDLREGKGEKVVMSRVIVKDNSIDIAEKFYELCERFPEAFVFCFATPVTGCWIGASPELLLAAREESVIAMSLAGTRKTGNAEPWDTKNIEEQRIVTDYILKALNNNNLKVESERTFTQTTGLIQHICTVIETKAPEEFDLSKLLKDLSPTPALCGYPKEFALDEIKRYENFERGCYGGFCGPFHSKKDFSFHVGVRCASINEKRMCIYTGGGITALSTPEDEWEETSIKAENTWKI